MTDVMLIFYSKQPSEHDNNVYMLAFPMLMMIRFAVYQLPPHGFLTDTCHDRLVN